jgi:hypothetical protein
MSDPAMKRLLTASVLSIAALALAAGQAPAWQLFHCCNRCCFSYCVCCRPYNAFSPVCFGNINCVGCCPPGNNGGWGGPMACAGADCQGGFMGQLPAATQPQQILPGTPSPVIPFQAPMPTPATGAQPTGYGAWMQAWPMVQAGYYPAYYPTYGYGR